MSWGTAGAIADDARDLCWSAVGGRIGERSTTHVEKTIDIIVAKIKLRRHTGQLRGFSGSSGPSQSTSFGLRASSLLVEEGLASMLSFGSLLVFSAMLSFGDEEVKVDW